MFSKTAPTATGRNVPLKRSLDHMKIDDRVVEQLIELEQTQAQKNLDAQSKDGSFSQRNIQAR
jgi:hypothetical protein